MTLGEKIRYARKACGLSQTQLAEKLCVSRSAIAKWETDKGLPDVENLKLLARLLNVSLDSLLDDREGADAPAVRERCDLTVFGPGCSKVKKDRMIRARFPDAQICPLLGRPELTARADAAHSTLGFLTPVPFSAPAYMKNVRDMDRAFYLVEQDNQQLFVSVTEEFLEIHPLPQRQTRDAFVLENWLFIRGAYLTDAID